MDDATYMQVVLNFTLFAIGMIAGMLFGKHMFYRPPHKHKFSEWAPIEHPSAERFYWDCGHRERKRID